MRIRLIIIFFWAMQIVPGYTQLSPVSPFPDAVPYSDRGQGSLFLSNSDAETIVQYLVNDSKPDRILPIKDGYFSGYRLCYNDGKCVENNHSSDWVQVLTIDAEACLNWFSENEPEALSRPFSGLKMYAGHFGHSNTDFKQVQEKYKYLPCRLYKEIAVSYGEYADEMSATLQGYQQGLFGQEDYFAAQSAITWFMRKGQAQNDHWDDWLNCLSEIDRKGYITLIEVHEPVALPFME